MTGRELLKRLETMFENDGKGVLDAADFAEKLAGSIPPAEYDRICNLDAIIKILAPSFVGRDDPAVFLGAMVCAYWLGKESVREDIIPPNIADQLSDLDLSGI